MNTDQQIIEKFINSHAPEATRIIEKLSYAEIAAFLTQVPPELAAKIIEHMNSYRASRSLEQADISLTVQILTKMDQLITELLIRQYQADFRNKLLEKMPKELSVKIRQKLKYAENTIGSIMSSKVFSIQHDLTVKEAEVIIKKEKELKLSEVYITNKQGRFEGIITLQDLVLAKGNKQIATILLKDIPKLPATDTFNIALIKDLPWVEYKAFPVVDKTGMLVGALHFEDIKMLSEKEGFNREILETGNALGELFRIGITGLLQSTGRLG